MNTPPFICAACGGIMRAEKRTITSANQVSSIDRFTWHFDNKERFSYRSTGPSKQNIIWLKQICRNIRIINITKRDRTPCHGIFVDIAYANHSDAARLFCWCIVPVLNGFCD